MNNQLIFSFAILLLISLFFMPALFPYLKLKAAGAKITFPDCLFMFFRGTLKKELIQAIYISQENKLPVDIPFLESHYLAGGSPLKCVEAIRYANAKGLNINYQMVSTADLSGVDLTQAIDHTVKGFLLELRDANLKDASYKRVGYYYSGSFMMEFGRACFAPPEADKISDIVERKIERFIEYTDTTDKLHTADHIIDTLLDDNFWESLGLKPESQQLRLID